MKRSVLASIHWQKPSEKPTIDSDGPIIHDFAIDDGRISNDIKDAGRAFNKQPVKVVAGNCVAEPAMFEDATR